MAPKPVTLTFAGDSQQLERSFAKVGAGAQSMASDVDKSSKRLASSASDASSGIAGAVDASEGKFRGLGDVIGGTGDVMDGFKSGNVAQMAMGFADLAGGLSTLVIPAITAMRTALMTGLAPALTAISAHPLIAGIIAGGAIIAGLILLEKKFGLVSAAADVVKGAFSAAFNFIRDGWNNIFGGKGFSFTVPDWPGVPHRGETFDFRLPRFHTGGMVGGVGGREMMAVLQAGETVVPRGQSAAGMNVTINVSALDAAGAANAVVEALRQWETRNGPVRMALR